MVSPSKLAANRANAQRSTGPSSPKGKATASRNAVKHGLAASALNFEPAPAEIDCLTKAVLKHAVVGSDPNLARRIAEAQYELNKVRQARNAILRNIEVERVSYNPPPPMLSAEDRVKSASRMLSSGLVAKLYKEFYKNKNRRVKRSLPISLTCEFQDFTTNNKNQIIPEYKESIKSVSDRADELALIAKQLLALDRYERRALSRRKFAIREFDQHNIKRLT